MSCTKHVSIGVNCTMTNLLKGLGLRTEAYPFDWNVTYDGIADVVSNNFKDFTTSKFNKNYNVYFHHHDFPSDTEVYERRILRLQTLLTSEVDSVIFYRLGHYFEHHKELCQHYNIEKTLNDDISLMMHLDDVLQQMYPKLQYTIKVFVVCPKCEVGWNISNPRINVYDMRQHSTAYSDESLQMAVKEHITNTVTPTTTN